MGWGGVGLGVGGDGGGGDGESDISSFGHLPRTNCTSYTIARTHLVSVIRRISLASRPIKFTDSSTR